RLVRTFRGGDRPKNAEVEFPDVCSMPRGCYEPWGLFRKPLDKGMTVADCLRLHGTGGLRRNPSGGPFLDVLECERTPKREKEIAGHPSLKPQSLMRRLAWAALPTGRGLVLDPFMGSGSTLAACEALGLDSIGVERSPEFYEIAVNSVAKLARVEISSPSGESMLAEIEAEPFIGETLFTVDKSSSTSASQTPSA
ncbi:MAG: DNA methyltransferase, partial [Roseimicrobium sp.]